MQGQESKPKPKKPYSTPKLATFGDARKLTRDHKHPAGPSSSIVPGPRGK
jgi:hypothetical protein